MRKPYILTVITLMMLLLAFGGCNGDTPTTTKSSQTTSTEPTTTTPTTEAPVDIEIDYEFTGNETRQLIDVNGLKASTITQKVIIDGNVYQLKNAVANVTIWADFYDASGGLLGTVERLYTLQGAWAMVYQEFRLTLGIEDPSLVARCQITINAYE